MTSACAAAAAGGGFGGDLGPFGGPPISLALLTLVLSVAATLGAGLLARRYRRRPRRLAAPARGRASTTARKPPRRRIWQLARMGAAFTAINVARGFIRRLLRPQYLWVVYPGTEQDKRHYFPERVERLLRPLYSTGLMRFGRFWGLMVAGKATAESLDDSPERLRELLDSARRDYPRVQVIALAGRLPSLAFKAGVPLEPPFTPGDKGTLCTMVMTARQQARLLDKPSREVSVAVVGGAGFIGRRLVNELKREFRLVISLDPRFAERREEANVLFSGEPQDIAAAQAVLVLTSRGEQAASVIPFLSPGTVVADDTHPEMPRSVRNRMQQAGALVLKATMGDARFRIVPRVPFFRSDDIPGCVLEALVILEHGRGVLVSQKAFNDAATALGFGVRLAPHVSEGLALADLPRDGPNRVRWIQAHRKAVVSEPTTKARATRRRAQGL